MASGNGSFRASIKVEGAKEVLAMFKDLPKEASDALRNASLPIGNELAGAIKAAAPHSRNPQAALLAQSVVVKRDRVPKVQAGGSFAPTRKNEKKVGKDKTAEAILFATEFGLQKAKGHGFQRRVKDNHGAKSYWFLAAVDADSDKVAQMWRDAVGQVLLAANNVTPGVS